MNLTNTQRLTRVLQNLLANPNLILPYIRHNILSKKIPMDIGYPWWSYTAINHVNSIIKDKSVFEYGTGGSTIFFSKKAKTIYAVEDDKNWLGKVQDRLKKLKIKNVEIVWRPFDFLNPVAFEASEYVHSIDEGKFDIIVIDGQDWSFKERITCFEYAERNVQPGQVIIVDDFWRYTQLIKNNRARELKVFESVGPGRLGVTSTAVFYY